MAIQLEDFDFGQMRKHSKYNWDLWLNGAIWQLLEGDDFTCKPSVMVSNVKHAAKTRDITVQVVIRQDDENNTVVVLRAELDAEADDPDMVPMRQPATKKRGRKQA